MMSRVNLRDPQFRFQRIIEILPKFVKDLNDSKLLDLGCHNGEFINLIQKEFGINAIGIDSWNENLKNDINWKYYKYDLNSNFNLDEKFEIISALEIIEHIIDTDQFLNICYRHLKDDGHLVLSTPNINSLRNRVGVPLGYYPIGLEYKNIIHHVRLYNMKKLVTHLAEHNFKVLEVTGVNLLPIILLKNKLILQISDMLSSIFPFLCNNLIVVAKKI